MLNKLCHKKLRGKTDRERYSNKNVRCKLYGYDSVIIMEVANKISPPIIKRRQTVMRKCNLSKQNLNYPFYN